jgi:hypothetical protein
VTICAAQFANGVRDADAVGRLAAEGMPRQRAEWLVESARKEIRAARATRLGYVFLIAGFQIVAGIFMSFCDSVSAPQSAAARAARLESGQERHRRRITTLPTPHEMPLQTRATSERSLQGI